jgi:hypothetical protein
MISNIRSEGCPAAAAVDTLLWPIAELRRLQLTGIALKDEQSAPLPYLVPLPDAALHD